MVADCIRLDSNRRMTGKVILNVATTYFDYCVRLLICVLVGSTISAFASRAAQLVVGNRVLEFIFPIVASATGRRTGLILNSTPSLAACHPTVVVAVFLPGYRSRRLASCFDFCFMRRCGPFACCFPQSWSLYQ